MQVDAVEKFNIRFVASLTGISVHTLRAWEKRYSVVRPSRDPKGNRLYSMSDVNRLRDIKKLVDAGNKISIMAELPSERIKNLLKQCDLETSPKPSSTTVQSLGLVCAAMRSAVQHENWEVLDYEISKCCESFDRRTLALEVIETLKSVDFSEHANPQEIKRFVEEIVEQGLCCRLIDTSAKIGNYGRWFVVNLAPEYHDFSMIQTALLLRHYKKRALRVSPFKSTKLVEGLFGKGRFSGVVVLNSPSDRSPLPCPAWLEEAAGQVPVIVMGQGCLTPGNRMKTCKTIYDLDQALRDTFN